MWLTILKRVAYGIFWIWVISLLAFFLSRQVPGDVIEEYISLEQHAVAVTLSAAEERALYQQVAHKRGLDLPAFYFSVHKGVYPESLFQILPVEERNAVRHWINHSHNGEKALDLHHSLRHALVTFCAGAKQPAACNEIDRSLRESSPAMIKANLERTLTSLDSNQRVDVENIWRTTDALHSRSPIPWSAYLPSFQWHGLRNQYHQWISGILAQRPLVSLTDGRDAWSKIREAIRWTLVMNVVAFLLTIVLGCLIGIWSSLRDRTLRERIINVVLFAAFAVPSFWLATLGILFFSSGDWLSILPSGGLGPYHRADNWFGKWGIIARHLILPVTCLTVGSIAYVSRQMKQSMLHELSQPYVRAMRAQGMRETVIVRRHVVRNAMFPIITIMGQSLPALISGSLVIEVIFSIPGMGRLLFTSILARDWPVVFPVLMIGAVVTVMAYILMDIVYAWVDPRVKSIG